MKNMIRILMLVLLCTLLCGCHRDMSPADADDAQKQTETCRPSEAEDAAMTEPEGDASFLPEWESGVKSPEEMPSEHHSDAELPPQPQPTVLNK